jgi:hypothetical protein
MKKFKALRNVRIYLSDGHHLIKEGMELPSQGFHLSEQELDVLSKSPAFEKVKEPKKKPDKE